MVGGAVRRSGRSSVVQPALSSRHKASHGRVATAIIRTLVINSGPMELGSWFRRSIVQPSCRTRCSCARSAAAIPRRLGNRLIEYREACEAGDRRACVRLRILIGENRERRAAWRRDHPEAFFSER
jgi:hypothetical protein